jgi:hypothetical protein
MNPEEEATVHWVNYLKELETRRMNYFYTAIFAEGEVFY